MTAWKLALNEYKNQTGVFIIPKRGTPEYTKIKEIQAKLEPESKAPATKQAGKGFIKNRFTNLVKSVNNKIDKNLEAVPGNIPLENGEFHAKKIVLQNGKVKYQNYNYAGPGTNVATRLSRGDRPIDGIDAAARQHDIDYTNNFQERMKKGQKVTKKEVQEADKRFVEATKMSKRDNIAFASIIPPLFQAKKAAEDTGVLSHTSFFDPNKTGSGINTISELHLKNYKKRIL